MHQKSLPTNHKLKLTQNFDSRDIFNKTLRQSSPVKIMPTHESKEQMNSVPNNELKLEDEEDGYQAFNLEVKSTKKT